MTSGPTAIHYQRVREASVVTAPTIPFVENVRCWLFDFWLQTCLRQLVFLRYNLQMESGIDAKKTMMPTTYNIPTC